MGVNQCAKLTAAAFNSTFKFLFFMQKKKTQQQQTNKQRKFIISCKYVQKETDLIYFVSLLEVYDDDEDVQECFALEYLLI